MVAIRSSLPSDTSRLLDIWRRAVRATHHFLPPKDFDEIEKLVANDYLPGVALLVAVDETDKPLGFMGLSGTHIDALFVDPDMHGRGIGRLLIGRAVKGARTVTVDVNEQNGQAVSFYRRLGFGRIGRSETDSEGRPFPLLHLSITVPTG